MKGEGAPGLQLGGRDAEIVRVIEGEELSDFTFDGLRRITGSHPETLSRVLGRLEEDGFVKKSPYGYSATSKARTSGGARPLFENWSRVPILHTLLPYGANLSELVSSLQGRWFDNLRWVGVGESEEGVTMKWMTDDGSIVVDVKLFAGQLDVEARMKSDAGLADAVRAAHQIVGRVSRLYSKQKPIGRSSLLRVGYFRPYAM